MMFTILTVFFKRDFRGETGVKHGKRINLHIQKWAVYYI